MKRIPAIPTKFANTQFRSRLEARWAAFFDQLGWQWDYETLDLNGYIPDFIVPFPEPLLVEVRPLLGSPDHWLDGAEAHDGAALAMTQIKRSGWKGKGLLVGANLHEARDAGGGVVSGLAIAGGIYFDTACEGPDRTCFFYSSTFGFSACCSGPIDVNGDFWCLRCGHRDRHARLTASALLRAAWREAGNLVQWLKPRT